MGTYEIIQKFKDTKKGIIILLNFIDTLVGHNLLIITYSSGAFPTHDVGGYYH